MPNLHDLATKLRRQAAAVEQIGPTVAAEVVKAIAYDVIAHTPVDEGHTVASWELGVGAPPSADRLAYIPGRKGSTASENRSLARLAIDAILAAPKRPGVSYFLSNASEAIGYLNDGSSRQEPAGFVERAILVGRLRLKELNTRTFRGLRAKRYG